MEKKNYSPKKVMEMLKDHKNKLELFKLIIKKMILVYLLKKMVLDFKNCHTKVNKMLKN